MLRRVIFPVAIMMLAAPAFAGQPKDLRSWTGAELKKQCAANVAGQGDPTACNDFLLGVNNAHSLAAGVWKKPIDEFLWCLPDTVNASEVVKPILDVIGQKPELSSQPAIVAIYGAWAKAFPCKKK
jgi:hypothetical protein